MISHSNQKISKRFLLRRPDTAALVHDSEYKDVRSSGATVLSSGCHVPLLEL